MALFRTDFSGRGELSERQQKVRVLLHSLYMFTVLKSSQLAQVGEALLMPKAYVNLHRCYQNCQNCPRSTMCVTRYPFRDYL